MTDQKTLAERANAGGKPCQCGGDTFVRDSRPTTMQDGLAATRRRRICKSCAASWSTYEVDADFLNRLEARVRGELTSMLLRQLDRAKDLP